jgi:hypothetical protein
MQITVTPAVTADTDNYRLQDSTASNLYARRHDGNKQASEDDNSNAANSTQQNPSRRDYYPSRPERPQQKVEKVQVRLLGII